MLRIFVFTLCVASIVCPPVENVEKMDQQKADHTDKPKEDVTWGLEYEKYLKEVVSVLESDEVFKKKIETANATDIKNGDIARHLEFVSHGVRSQLDELKRREVDRLRTLVNLKWKADKAGMDDREVKRLIAHIDHMNMKSFNKEDLEKLIKTATKDLDELDKTRREDFKKYEMEKEHLEKEKLKKLDEEERKKEEARIEEQKKKHKEHHGKKVHQPGHKEQLEEVWEDEDGMDQEFNPRTFFMMHDLNGDGFLDEEELESLFEKELDKIYNPKDPDYDQVEREEERSRMREHVLKQIDKNGDKEISFDEFVDATKEKDFEDDPEWEPLDEDAEFTAEEFEAYEKQRAEEIARMEVAPGEINIPLPSTSHIPPVPAENPEDTQLKFKPHDAGAQPPAPAEVPVSQDPLLPAHSQEHVQQKTLSDQPAEHPVPEVNAGGEVPPLHAHPGAAPLTL